MSLPLGRIKQEVAVDEALISTVLIKLGLWSFIEIPILSLISDLIPFLVLLVKREVAAYEALISPDFDMKLRFWGFIDILNLSLMSELMSLTDGQLHQLLKFLFLQFSTGPDSPKSCDIV